MVSFRPRLPTRPRVQHRATRRPGTTRPQRGRARRQPSRTVERGNKRKGPDGSPSGPFVVLRALVVQRRPLTRRPLSQCAMHLRDRFEVHPGLRSGSGSEASQCAVHLRCGFEVHPGVRRPKLTDSGGLRGGGGLTDSGGRRDGGPCRTSEARETKGPGRFAVRALRCASGG